MRRSKVCFIGYGSTEYSRNSEASALSYYADAIRDALKRTGIDKKEIRGFSITTQASPDYSPHVAEQLGLEVDWVLNGDYGGAGGVMSVRRAADAIECGHLDLAVLVGGNSFDRSTPTQRQLEYQRGNFVDVFGYGGPNSLMALIQRLHMTNYGTTLEQIGKIAVAQRFNALNNPQALFREANRDGYFAEDPSEFVSLSRRFAKASTTRSVRLRSQRFSGNSRSQTQKDGV